MSMDVQRQIRENTLELNEFLKDLKGWEHTVKEKEKKFQSQGSSKDHKTSTGVPRRQPSTGSEVKGKEIQKGTAHEPEVKGMSAKTTKVEPKVQKQDSTSSKAGSTAARHTYENFRDKWDNFDVDAALKEIDEEEKDQPVKKVSKREVAPPRGLQSKVGIGNSLPQAAAVSHALPPGKVLGRDIDPMAAVSRLSGSFGFDDTAPDAASEKDLAKAVWCKGYCMVYVEHAMKRSTRVGNEYFKEGKYVRAIDCYSRSIALQPTAVAYANRAMAAIKIKRFEDAELDCSEAILLDDRYTKAYARRGTARKELKKYLLAVEDFEFALLLEPGNKELQKQYTEAEELCQKETGLRPPQQGSRPVMEEKRGKNVHPPQQYVSGKSELASVDNSSITSMSSRVTSSSISMRDPTDISADSLSAKSKLPTDADLLPSTRNSGTIPTGVVESQAVVRQRKIADVAAATQAAAARAAASAMAAVSRNIVAPRSSYEFELTWKGLGGNQSSQARLLQIMDPLSIPKVFKDSLSAPLLLEIIQSLEVLYPENANLAVQWLENLTKVGRFNMTLMFLTAKEKKGLEELWERISRNSPGQLQAQLQALRGAYRLV